MQLVISASFSRRLCLENAIIATPDSARQACENRTARSRIGGGKPVASRGLRRPGTKSSPTLRWRKADSNCWSHLGRHGFLEPAVIDLHLPSEPPGRRSCIRRKEAEPGVTK